jgi:hypothetical protein
MIMMRNSQQKNWSGDLILFGKIGNLGEIVKRNISPIM